MYGVSKFCQSAMSEKGVSMSEKGFWAYYFFEQRYLRLLATIYLLKKSENSVPLSVKIPCLNV